MQKQAACYESQGKRDFTKKCIVFVIFNFISRPNSCSENNPDSNRILTFKAKSKNLWMNIFFFFFFV